MSETGLGAVAGVPLAVYGVDQVITGTRNIAYGKRDRAGVEELVYAATGSEQAAVLLPAAATLSLWAIGPRLARVGARAGAGAAGVGSQLTSSETGALSHSSSLRRLFARTTETGSHYLPAGAGETDKFGNVIFSLLGSARETAVAQYHESIHSLLSPKFIPMRTLRADLRMWAYRRSPLMRYAEEALCETYAQFRLDGLGLGSLWRGIKFPVTHDYVNFSDVIFGGGVVVVVIGGYVYLCILVRR